MSDRDKEINEREFERFRRKINQIKVECPECEYKGKCDDDPQKSDYCPKRVL